MHSGLVRWEWHSLDHVKAGRVRSRSALERVPLGLLPPQLDRPAGRTASCCSRRAARGPATSVEAGTGRIRWRLGGNHSSFQMGRGTEMAWQHDGRMRSDGTVTFFDDGSNPPIHSQSRGLVIAIDLNTRTRRGSSSPTMHREPADARREPGQHADALGRQRADRLRRRAADQPVRRRRLAAVRRPPALRHVLLPRLPLPVERAAGRAAGDRRERQQHRRRDDRPRELERGDRRRLLAGARRRNAAGAVGARDDPGRAASRAASPCRTSTSTPPCRRSTAPAGCWAPRRRAA